MMNYEEAQVYLYTALRFGIKLGLHRMQRLAQLLGDPQKQLSVIHIAGTNGKGSTTTYCAAILAAAGHRVGVYTSPYLERLTERIRIIDGPVSLQRLAVEESEGEITPEDFARIMTRVRQCVNTMLEEGEEHPTEFELLTAIAFVYYAEMDCDFVVLETGLGGRLDATNIIERPLACIITALGYDHMDRLGHTLAEIAAEKAGIIKSGCPVFFYDPADLDLPLADRKAALQVIRSHCTALEAPLHIISRHTLVEQSYDWSGQRFTDLETGLTVSTVLLGVIMSMNAALAMRTCLSLGLADAEQIATGIAGARWPARLELLRRHPPVLLDGAHNPQCCRALADSLNRLLPGQPLVFLGGVLADKDFRAMLDILLNQVQYRPCAFVCVRPDNLRALPAEQLAAAVREVWQLPDSQDNQYNEMVRVAETAEQGAVLALKLALGRQVALCAFGSLYMVGNIRPILLSGRYCGELVRPDQPV